ncbi:MAG: ACT domain-containing protein, partial [Ignavibacteriaceae bacterium]|nr:ACT domain-containing protein [Ignavibacteriaceae bacterium]
LEEIDQPVNPVNANILSEERGITLEEGLSTQHRDYQNLIEASIETDSEKWKFSGTVFGDNEIRIIKINNFPVEFKPEGNIIIYLNIDKPGMLASVSRELSLSNINIASLSLGRLTEGDEALTVVNLDSAIDEHIKKSILAIEGIKAIYSVSI